MHSSLRAVTIGAALLVASLASPTRSARAAAAPGPARWTEWHASGDDATITIDRAGLARIEHVLRYRVVMGPMREIELSGIEKGALVAPTATVTGEDGHETTAQVESNGEGKLHVTVDEPKGLKRGNYTFRLRYEVDLVAAKELARDGALWRLTWRSPVASEGYDAARVLVKLPAAPTEPRRVKTGARPAGPEEVGGEGDEDGVVATLHRTTEEDELELLRPHVARGEAAVWAARVDPKAFPDVRAPELRAPPPAPPAEPNRVREVSWACAIAAVALLFGAVVRSKLRGFARACERARVEPAPLVPIASGALGAVAGAAFGAGILLEALAWPTAGASLVALAMLCAVSRTPASKRAPRGPGCWLALREDDAFAVAPRAATALRALDVGTRAGKISVAVLVAAVVGAAALARAIAPEAPYFVVIDALAFVPLFVTGRAAQLPPDLARDAAPLLAGALRALRRDDALKVAPWARVPMGANCADELRVLVVPRASLPGLVGIELGVAWTRTATAWAPSFEVLVRAHDGSDAAARTASIAPFARPVTGRRPEEKVVVFSPRLPGRAAALALVRRLACELVDRRVDIGGWTGTERRADRERTDRVPAAA